MAFSLPAPPVTMASSSAPDQPHSLLTRLASPFSTRRDRKQAGLFFAGAFFFLFSSAITRRALVRRQLAAVPARFTPSNQPNRNFSGAVEGVEALSLATVNVSSAALMLTGGTLWALDISSIEDLRRKVRGGMGVDGTGRSESEVEEEFEEWLASVITRKERKEEERRRRGELEPEWRNERGRKR